MSTTADELARRIQIVHRGDGYLRLALPAELCTPSVAAALEQGLGTLAGVRKASLDSGWQRLSVYHDETCTAPRIARQLHTLLANLSWPRETPEAAPAALATAEPGSIQPLLDRLQRLLGLDAPAPEGSLQARLQPVLASALSEKAIYNFLNDLLAFYLVKAHWELITKRWIKTPLAYSNAWLSVFYLVFLLVRQRKRNAAR